jgi:sulfide dehydrogenase cytochrome subunit
MTPVPFSPVLFAAAYDAKPAGCRAIAFDTTVRVFPGVIPAKAGIQSRRTRWLLLDARFRGHDNEGNTDRPASGRGVSLGMAAVIALSMVAGLTALAASRSAMADSDQGARLAATCASCHRLDGQDDGIPSVVGQDAESLTRKMQAFKSGEQTSMIMHAVALTLSDEEVAILARYLAEQGKGATQP